MKTINTILADNKLTENEIAVVTYLNSALQNHIGSEDYSCEDCNDIAKGTNLKVATVKGVVGSLVKKGICDTYDTTTGYDVVNFVGQRDEMTFEEVGQKVEVEEVYIRTVRVSTIIMSHLNDFKFDNDVLHTNFVYWLVFHYDNMKEEIDPIAEFEKFTSNSK